VALQQRHVEIDELRAQTTALLREMEYNPKHALDLSSSMRPEDEAPPPTNTASALGNQLEIEIELQGEPARALSSSHVQSQR